MREDLKRATALVRNGETFSEAATKLRLTRNQVAGACHRAGAKMSNAMKAAHMARIAEANAERMRALLKDHPAFGRKRLQALRASKRRSREEARRSTRSPAFLQRDPQPNRSAVPT
jgi:hypothetical protein